jgi:hypothetical protein
MFENGGGAEICPLSDFSMLRDGEISSVGRALHHPSSKNRWW